jgi:hypothetical protein
MKLARSRRLCRATPVQRRASPALFGDLSAMYCQRRGVGEVI